MTSAAHVQRGWPKHLAFLPRRKRFARWHGGKAVRHAPPSPENALSNPTL